MAFTTREYTNKILELMDEGCIDPKPLAEQLLCWLSEHDVEEFYRVNFADAFEPEEEEEEDDPMDDYNYVGSPHHY